MKKGVTFAMIFTGTILSVFVINLAFFAMVPEYHDALVAAVSTAKIPVVRADKSMEIEEAVSRKVPVSTQGGITTYNQENSADVNNAGSNLDNVNTTKVNSVNENTADGKNDNSEAEGEPERILIPEDILEDYESSLTPLSAVPDSSTEKTAVIVGKEYHEDCGTGKGYWVITYSDGSTVIE